ncbi:MAG: hypothetical protein PHH58_01520, partial [Rhodoferax sp.]|nr:hypothetical protein [Rhodoferax sp.]
MASLTPLSKGLIGLAVVGAMASAVWHLVLKERLGSAAPTDWQSAPSATAPTPNSASTSPAPQPSPALAVQAPNVDGSSAENFETGRKLLANGDFAQARKHLEAAVHAGNGAAACLLGEMTLKGQGGLVANQ